MQPNYIKVRKSNLFVYHTVPLYYTANGERYGIYKPSGMNLKEMRVKENLIPRELFLKKTDKAKGMREVSIIVGEYIKDPEILKSFWCISGKDYTTAMHSVNVMALAIRYAISRKYNKTKTKLLGLCALLHDIGKTKTDEEILTAPRKLSDEDFTKIKSHPVQGYNLLKRCKFTNPEVKLTALQHHEKLDGSGYPSGLTQISEFSQIISILDCFEALTNDERPYRDSMIPYKALDLIQKDVMDGKLAKDIYAKFIYSLV